MALIGNVVLVVEDDDSMRIAIERLLQAAGYQTRPYGSAEALLAAGNANGAACVISDIKLPAMSGLELTSALRRQGGWPPVIVITSHDADDVRADAKRRGAVAYLAKPFQGSALLEAIRSVDAAPRI